MTILNPCCCVSPRIGTFILAIINLVYAVQDALLLVRAVINSRIDFIDNLIEIAMCALMIFLAALLLLGAIKNCQEKVRLWLWIWLVYIIVAIILEFLRVHSSRAFHWDRFVFLLFIYQLWVVYAYLTELRYGPAGLTYCPSQVV